MMADLLVSGRPIPGQSSIVPTRDDLSTIFPPNSVLVPRGLRQKIAIVSDDLVVGWAGTVAVAADVIGELVHLNAASPFTMETLDRHFDGLPASVWAKIGLVGHMVDPDGRIAYFGRGSHEVDSKLYGRIGLLGSGEADIHRFMSVFTSPPGEVDPELNRLEQAAVLALILAGGLLSIELKDDRSLKNYYGGGYEIVIREAGKFRKFDEISYIFWDATLDPVGMTASFGPRRMFRYKYQDDLLRIRSITLRPGPDGPIIDRNIQYLISPVYRDVTDDEVSNTHKISMNAKWLCNVFHVEAPDKGHLFFTSVNHQPGESEFVRFDEMEVGIKFGFSQRFLNDTAQMLADELRTHTRRGL